MRAWILRLAVIAAASGSACETASETNHAGGDGTSADDGGDSAPTDPSGQPFTSCRDDLDCRPAAATCCECPTFAVTADDPLYQACLGVECPAPTGCSASDAVCTAGRCQLACEPLACDAAFAQGFATDAAGCLTCDPALALGTDCTTDRECVQTRADCCGCASGGADTAVPASEQGSFDAMLGCAADAVCPGVPVCAADAAPRCVQGDCALLTGELPAGACGRPDLAACPAGEVCTLNLDDDATDRGLGICAPGP